MNNACEAAFRIAGGDPESPPRVTRCGEPGKLYKKFILPYGVYLCDKCYAVMEAKYRDN